MNFAFYVVHLTPTVNYVKAFPVLNLIQLVQYLENTISFVRNFGQFQFVKTLKIFVKSILNWPRTHLITYIFLSCLLSSFGDLFN